MEVSGGYPTKTAAHRTAAVLFPLTGSLERSQRITDRIEDEEQEERNVLVHVPLPVARPVAFRGRVMQIVALRPSVLIG